MTGKGYRPRTIDLGRWRYLAAAIFVVYFLLIVAAPLLVLLWSSVQKFYSVPSMAALKNLTFEPYRIILSHPSFARALWNSLILCVGSATIIMLVTAVIFLGQANRERYLLACSSDKIVAQRGRALPPWGWETMRGPEWVPVAIPPAAECVPRETGVRANLEAWFLDALVEQATARLTGTVGDVDVAEAQLQQALLLTRAPERRDQRKDLERLLGDVAYWRAVARVKVAAETLEDAARRFDDAAARRPADGRVQAEKVRAAEQGSGGSGNSSRPDVSCGDHRHDVAGVSCGTPARGS